MIFSSVTFIYIFIPAILIAYFITPKKFRNHILLVFSLLFYFSGEPKYSILLILSSVSDYLHSLYIEKHRDTKNAKVALVSSIIINLLMLGIFKYSDFVIITINEIFGLSIPLTNLPLPIGISFFTFQTMSYTIDVYRGDVHAEKNIFSFSTFVCLFPQLIAGPIVRYSDIA
ncbi:MAG: MBOAT family protein, partial [Oscillospiraceae bacterium]